MYLLNAANRLRSLFTAAAAGPSPIRLLRSVPFSHTPRRCAVDSPSPAAEDAGIDDLVYVGEGGKILGKCEIISQKKNAKRNYERKLLPPELLAPNVVRLTCESAADGGTCDVYLVGTNHNCPKTWRQTQAVVKYLEPQAVFLELCSDRVDMLRAPKLPTKEEMLAAWKKNENPSWIFRKWFDAKLQRRLGGEFLMAYEEAMRYGGKVILGDRPIGITEHRLWVKTSRWELLIPTIFCKLTKVNFFMSLILPHSPAQMEIIVQERDQYMSAKLLKVALEHNSVVAVVGEDHLLGIKKNWKQPVDMKELLHTPTITIKFHYAEILAPVAIIFVIYLCCKT